MLQVKYKIWLDDDGTTFGKGIYDLLVGVRNKGSLSEAAKGMGMSYSKAHNLIKKAAKRLNFNLLISASGGANGGGSCLTKEAEDFIKTYESFFSECDKCLHNIFYKYFKSMELNK